MALNIAAFVGVGVLAYNLGGQIQQTSASLQSQRTKTADLQVLHQDIVRSLSSGLLTVDLAGVVYYANYLRYYERGRTESLRDLGVEHSPQAPRAPSGRRAAPSAGHGLRGRPPRHRPPPHPR